MRKSTEYLLPLIFFILSACGSTVKKSYTNPNYPISKVSRIAILPFDGVSDANTVADMIGMVLESRQIFKAVVNRAEIQSIISEHRLPADLLDNDTTIAKKRLINADGLLKGRVTQYSQGVPSVPIATPTRISMSLTLISAETGQPIWTQIYSKSSGGRGLLSPSVDEMMIQMAEEVANDLALLK
jgi:hypothetical protein